MSATARNTRPAVQPMVEGSTARDARYAAALPERNTAPRTPLSVVPTGPARKRVPFAVFCFVVLVAALGCVLVLNISVSGGQYDIVKLRGEQVALAQQNEKLTQQLENRQAPQNLAAEAAQLGMVVSPSVGSIDLETMKVSGDPQAAKEGSAPSQLVERPELPAQALTPAEAAEAEAGAETGAQAPVEAEAPAAAEKAPEAEQQPAEPKRAAEQPSAGGSEKTFSPEELNGGTIPAPKQKTGQ
ncbi:hypothetical protein [Arthrobacter crystallopoietes]|uniref:hypothetical protein n=1 Tax=Crystallibacter crystallopoietes TaxID=37928 RepID=UPI001ABE24BC|nr:hypothetical protein [Arthrobacter crystallopoietes]QTG79905.1 hypothetical protein J5251_13490 [Arthrobacter crystallopoietes]